MNLNRSSEVKGVRKHFLNMCLIGCSDKLADAIMEFQDDPVTNAGLEFCLSSFAEDWLLEKDEAQKDIIAELAVTRIKEELGA